MSEQSAEEIATGVMYSHWLTVTDEQRIAGCHCGFRADIADYDYGDEVLRHFASEVVAALRSARLLLPEGAETAIEYGRRHPESTVVLPTSRFYAMHPASLMAAMQRSVWRGPWLPVEEETGLGKMRDAIRRARGGDAPVQPEGYA